MDLKDKVALTTSDCIEIENQLKIGAKGEYLDTLIDRFSLFAKASVKFDVDPIGGKEVYNMIEVVNLLGKILNEIVEISPDDERLDSIFMEFRKVAFTATEIRNVSNDKGSKLVCTVNVDEKRVITDQILLVHNSIFGNKNLLLVIDMQIDFAKRCGSLYVMNGEDAESNLIRWININRSHIDDILLTRDDHYPTQIGMYSSWIDSTGKTPDPFTTIASSQVESGEFTPRFIPKDKVISYLKKIESNGSSHTLWPLHCIHGSEGQQFSSELIYSLRLWSFEHSGKHYKTIDKGSRDDSEMYSVFSYADGSIPEYTKNMLDNIAGANFDKIFIAGLAKDICVASSVKDLVEDGRFKDKLVFLNSCMESINKKSPALNIYEEAEKNYGAISE